MKKFFAVLLCFTMFFSQLTSFAEFAEEEQTMLPVEAYLSEDAPVDITRPEEDDLFTTIPSPEELEEIEDIITSADLMTVQQASVELSAVPETFTRLDDPYTITLGSWKITIPDLFTPSPDGSDSLLVFTREDLGMNIGVGLVPDLTEESAGVLLMSQGFTVSAITVSGVNAVYGVRRDGELCSITVLFPNESGMVLLQSSFPAAAMDACVEVIMQFIASIRPVLTIGGVTYRISPDGKSCFIDRPAISGGSGSYSVAYNIYDDASSPINYFYSNENAVAATCPYNGLYNVYIVVNDLLTGEQTTAMTGWFNITGYEALTVTAPRWRLSADGRSCFIYRPEISGSSGHFTIAYNIYDSNGRAVNYFYSDDPAVAATCPCNGRYNIYVVITDESGISATLMTGWFNITGY